MLTIFNRLNQLIRVGQENGTGIDISEEGIKKAKESIANTMFHADYYVMDAEKTEFHNNSLIKVLNEAVPNFINET